jgi:hypothetical protein
MKLYSAVALLLPALLLTEPRSSGNDSSSDSFHPFPYPSKLTYQVIWRMLTAGGAAYELKPGNAQGWNISLDLTSAGLVSRLYRVVDTYKASTDSRFCGQSAILNAQEGKKHFVSQLTFDNATHKVSYKERNLLNNAITDDKELSVPPCTYEITGALASLRLLNLPPGKSMTLPITDGKRTSQVRIEAQARENIQFGGKTYPTTRYEAFLFDNILYKRKGRLFIWMTDDREHLPVQLRIQFGFPIGSILVELEKQELTADR